MPGCSINRIVRSIRRPGLRGSSLALLGIVELPEMIPRSDWLGVSEKSLLNQKSRFYHQIHHNQPCMHTHTHIYIYIYIYIYILLQIFKILSLSQIIHIFCTFFLKKHHFSWGPTGPTCQSPCGSPRRSSSPPNNAPPRAAKSTSARSG